MPATVDEPKTHLVARKQFDAGLGPTPVQAADVYFDPVSLAQPTQAAR